MAVVLTLIDGDAHADFVEHPTEVARRALMAAAEVESDGWPELLRRSARALPHRAPVRTADDGEEAS